MILKGEKVFLGPVINSDEYYNWMNENAVTQFLESRFHAQSKDDIQQYISAMSKNPDIFFFGIFSIKTMGHCGNIKLGPINWLHRFGEIGLVLRKEVWGKGFGTESIKLISKFAFDELGLHKIWCGCLSENLGSIKAFQKAGFKIEGTLKKQYWTNGKWMDDIIFGLTQEDYFSKNNTQYIISSIHKTVYS